MLFVVCCVLFVVCCLLFVVGVVVVVVDVGETLLGAALNSKQRWCEALSFL